MEGGGETRKRTNERKKERKKEKERESITTTKGWRGEGDEILDEVLTRAGKKFCLGPTRGWDGWDGMGGTGWGGE
jgi:hypothetical protein